MLDTWFDLLVLVKCGIWSTMYIMNISLVVRSVFGRLSSKLQSTYLIKSSRGYSELSVYPCCCACRLWMRCEMSDGVHVRADG